MVIEKSVADDSISESWAHAPLHRLSKTGTFLVTAGTYRKEAFFQGKDRLKALHDGLLKYSAKYGWHLEAWAVFTNHYHFIGHAPDSRELNGQNLGVFLADFHQHSAAWINRMDGKKGRKVWFNYFETRLTYEKSLLSRLNYVHHNPVKHGLVVVARHYPWCSAGWFEQNASPARVKTVYGFKPDQLKIPDDF